jgi:hypothetical protein
MVERKLYCYQLYTIFHHMDPITNLKSLVDALHPEPEVKSREYRTIRLRAEVHGALEEWRDAWGDKNLSDVVLRIMTLARGELMSIAKTDNDAL